MRETRSLTAITAAALCSLVLSIGAMSASAATVSADAAYKAAIDTDPHRSLTPYQERMRALKIQAVEAVLSGTASPESMIASLRAAGSTVTAFAAATVSASVPASSALAQNQVAQLEDHWCGPATVKEALGQLGKAITQAHMATDLKTTSSGTGWSAGGTSPSGYPVPDVMNGHQSKNYYIPEPVPGTPSDANVEDYKTFLTYDIATVRAPVIGDAWTTQYSEFWLVGHPQNKTIYHWFDVYGYRINSGTTYTKYEDSVHDAECVSWHAGVPAYSELPSHRIAHIVGGRGYVW